jgi:hypothetical protein
MRLVFFLQALPSLSSGRDYHGKYTAFAGITKSMRLLMRSAPDRTRTYSRDRHGVHGHYSQKHACPVRVIRISKKKSGTNIRLSKKKSSQGLPDFSKKVWQGYRIFSKKFTKVIRLSQKSSPGLPDFLEKMRGQNTPSHT